MNVIFAWLTALVLSTTPGTGGSYTFVGFLVCTDPHVLGGCLKNGTHFDPKRDLSEYDCYALKRQADAIPNGGGGQCLKQKEKQ